MRRISVVSYLNSLPFLVGLQTYLPKERWTVEIDYPGEIARKLKSGETDIGLVPVAAIPFIPDAQVITNFGIASDGKVNSVFLFSCVPLEEISQVLLDFESRTSVALVKVLARDYWKVSWRYTPTQSGYESQISGKVAGVVIGDRAIRSIGKYPYTYDLSEMWKNLTGFPFVFARWVSRVRLDFEEAEEFFFALDRGLEEMDQLVFEEQDLKEIGIDFISNYLKNNILHRIGPSEEKGMMVFLERGLEFFQERK
jgi:chorismate dehydratase